MMVTSFLTSLSSLKFTMIILHLSITIILIMKMIPLGVLGGKSAVVIVVSAQDGLEVGCPCSLPLFEKQQIQA